MGASNTAKLVLSVARLIPVTLMLQIATSEAALKPLEIRRHWSMERSIEEASIPDEVKAALAKNGMPAGSIIIRSWYRTLPADNRWTADGAVRSEAIVMMDLATEGIRFKWSTDNDYQSGDVLQELVIWKGPERFQVVTARWTNPLRAHDWSSAIAEGKKLRERGHLPKEGDTIITISFGGREWTTTDREWAHGDLLPEDVAALEPSMSDALLEVLEKIEAVAQMTPDLFTVCTTITHPLLGRFDTPCELHRGAINLLQGPPDCRFDARFGETCSAAELMASDRDQQPELSRPAREGR